MILISIVIVLMILLNVIEWYFSIDLKRTKLFSNEKNQFRFFELCLVIFGFLIKGKTKGKSAKLSWMKYKNVI